LTHDVERVLADIDADHGDRSVEFLRHGVLLVLNTPCQLLVPAGPEHGRTIPLADVETSFYLEIAPGVQELPCLKRIASPAPKKESCHAACSSRTKIPYGLACHDCGK
jgi:hypothetical protein